MLNKISFLLAITISYLCVSQHQELVIQSGHNGGISQLGFCENTNFLLSSGRDHNVILWDILVGKALRNFDATRHPVTDIVMNTQDSSIYAVDQGGFLYAYNLHQNDPLWSKKISDYLSCIVPDIAHGKIYLAGDKVYEVQLHNHSIKTIYSHPHNNIFNAMAINPDLRLLAIGGEKSSKIHELNLDSYKEVAQYHLKASKIQYAKDGTTLTATSPFGKVRRWQREQTLKEITRTTVTSNKWIDAYKSVALSEQLEYVVGGNRNGQIDVYDAKSSTRLYKVFAHEGSVNCLAIDETHRYLLSSGQDDKIMIWDLKTGVFIKQLKHMGVSVSCVDKHSKELVMGTLAGEIIISNYDPSQKGVVYQVKKTVVDQLKQNSLAIEQVFHRGNQIEFVLKKSRVTLKKKHINTLDNYRLGILNLTTEKLKISNLKSYPVVLNDTIYTYKNNNIMLQSLDGELLGKRSTSNYSKKNIKAAFYFAGQQFFVTKRDSLVSINENGTEKKFHFDLNNQSIVRAYKDNLFISSSDHTLIIDKNGDELTKLRADHVLINNNKIYYSLNNKIYTLSIDFSSSTLLQAFDHNIRQIIEVTNENVFDILLNNGTIHHVDLNKDLEVTFVPVNGNEKVFVNKHGYYTGTKAGMHALAYNIADHAVGFEQLDFIYDRPDLILDELGYANKNLVQLYEKAYNKRLSKLHITKEDLESIENFPNISITNEASFDVTTKEASINLDIDASDMKHGLSLFQIVLNGVPINTINLNNDNTFKKSITVNLTEGKNLIQCFVRNELGLQSVRSTVNIIKKTQRKTYKPNLYIISIGVSNYKDGQYNLKYASKDAKDITKLFSRHKHLYKEVFTKELLNEKVTIENFNELRTFLQNSKKEDKVIIFMAGHGIMDKELNYYFGTHDIDFQNPGSRGLSYKLIESLLSEIEPLSKLLFLDTCHSGEVDDEEVTASSSNNGQQDKKEEDGLVFRAVGPKIQKKHVGTSVFELSKTLFSNLESSSGANIISSAGGAEYAIEGDQWNNSVFTYSIINGLKNDKGDINHDSTIDLVELHDYVSQTVSDLTNGRQKPTSREVNYNQTFVIW